MIKGQLSAMDWNQKVEYLESILSEDDEAYFDAEICVQPPDVAYDSGGHDTDPGFGKAIQKMCGTSTPNYPGQYKPHYCALTCSCHAGFQPSNARAGQKFHGIRTQNATSSPPLPPTLYPFTKIQNQIKKHVFAGNDLRQ